jgi:hypothetical protein
MKQTHPTSDINLKESFVSKLSPTDSSLEGLLAKLALAWAGWFGGVTLSDVFTLASIVYVVLNIYVLVRDKIIAPRKRKSSYDLDQTSGD